MMRSASDPKAFQDAAGTTKAEAVAPQLAFDCQRSGIEIAAV